MGEARRRRESSGPYSFKGDGYKSRGGNPTFYRIVEPQPKQRSLLSKKERSKIKRQFKREFGLTRRAVGAIGAGHMPWPEGA